jgi:hypothetical protein
MDAFDVLVFKQGREGVSEVRGVKATEEGAGRDRGEAGAYRETAALSVGSGGATTLKLISLAAMEIGFLGEIVRTGRGLYEGALHGRGARV